MSLLPSPGPDVDSRQEGEFRIVGLDDEQTGAVFEALSPETARAILTAVHDDPGTPSELADRADTSIQNVMYHLNKLEDADLVEVAGTRYSAKGKEMKVYTAADNPCVMFIGTDERRQTLVELVTRILGSVGVLAVFSIIVQRIVEGSFPYIDMLASNQPAQPGVPLASAIFAGGVLTLVLIAGWTLLRRRWPSIQETWSGHPLLVGDEQGLGRRERRVAIGVFLASSGFWFSRAILAPGLVAFGPVSIVHVSIGVLITLSIISGWLKQSLLTSWVIVFAATFGTTFHGVGIAISDGVLPHWIGLLGYGVMIAGLSAFVFGTGGFALGFLLRSAMAQVAPTSEANQT